MYHHNSWKRRMAAWFKAALFLLLCVGFLRTDEARPYHLGGERWAENIKVSAIECHSLVRKLEWRGRALIVGDRKREIPGGPDPQHHY